MGARQVKVSQVTDKYEELGEKYSLDPRDIKLLFLQALSDFFKTDNIEIYGDGIIVDEKYRNIKYQDFGKIISNFNVLCNERSFLKIETYVESLLAREDYIIYAKVVERNDYKYVLQPMLSRNSTLRYVAPITIERQGEKIPENISILPIQIQSRSRKRNDNNTLSYSAKLFSAGLAKVHLAMVLKKLEEKYRVVVALEVKTYMNGRVYIVNRGKNKKLSYKIVSYVVNYFKNFSVVACIKTKIDRSA
jgi:hypothetical protein